MRVLAVVIATILFVGTAASQQRVVGEVINPPGVTEVNPPPTAPASESGGTRTLPVRPNRPALGRGSYRPPGLPPAQEIPAPAPPPVAPPLRRAQGAAPTSQPPITFAPLSELQMMLFINKLKTLVSAENFEYVLQSFVNLEKEAIAQAQVAQSQVTRDVSPPVVAPGASPPARASRSRWEGLSKEEVEALTRALRGAYESPGEVSIFCASGCDDLADDLEEAIEAAGWSVGVERPLSDTNVGINVAPSSAAAQKLASLIATATGGRLRPGVIDAEIGDRLAIIISRKPR